MNIGAGQWAAVDQAVGAGYASKRRWTVQRPGQWYATNGRVHRYATEAAAAKVAAKLNESEANARTLQRDER